MYTLRLPFELPNGYDINGTDKPIIYGELECKLKKESRFYALVIKGFNTEAEAEKFISKSWSGLMWVLINCGLAPLWKTEPQKITYAENPVEAAKNLSKSFKTKIEGEVHGLIDGSLPAIFASDGNFRSITGGNVSITTGTSSERFFEYFFNGIGFKNCENGFQSQKLRIALELYGAFFSETTPNAKFLTLVMVLESLAESEKRPDAVLDLLLNFRGQIEEIETTYSEGSLERVSLESLKRELTYRQEDSIRKKIRSLVFNTLSKNGDSDALEVAKQSLKIYDKRSTLVHDGSLKPEELGSISTQARAIVERVLKAKFIQIVNENNV